MPVIVVGADTRLGEAVVDALAGRDGEIRAFVSDPEAARSLKARGIKTALGDVSDGSHVGGAACNCFGAVLIGQAAVDERERSFADDPAAVAEAWAEGLADAGVHRAIWVVSDPRIVPGTPHAVEVAVVDATASPATISAEVRRLDDAATL